MFFFSAGLIRDKWQKNLLFQISSKRADAAGQVLNRAAKRAFNSVLSRFPSSILLLTVLRVSSCLQLPG